MNRNWFTKLIAIAGTILNALPIAAPFVFSLLFYFTYKEWRFDYLMPAELSPLAIAGGALLLWAAIRMGTHRWFVAGSLALAVIALFGSQGIAEVTGLASGEAPAEGLPLIAVITGLVIYILSVISRVVWGWRLIRQAFFKEESVVS
jgi:hypothetical protein